ncbi:hypothetical protein FJR11_06305 [Anabaena sp. UHCC 0187]|uniref:hypothetical protein n=1 Tax=Anabaena sp. UHCC 0187 TaxID=2590018 RepID=UPI0014474F67|nr:hypothetical protein [Anabaena sp. UHCC 0187]MTJ12214.1 hypothetical protein [Anabaena sp. UHCC 0187]
MDLPCWLTKKQLYVAQQLINQGFHYCGNADGYCEPNFSIPIIDGWELSFPPGECFLDASCNKALFTKNLEGKEFNFQAELKATRRLIRTASKEYDCTGINHYQMALF